MLTLVYVLFKWLAFWILGSILGTIGLASWIVWRLSRGEPDDRL